MTNIFQDTIEGKKTSRPPIWFMRQAGRVLPNYLKLREKYSFNDLMHDSSLCSEVTIMPVHDIGVDACILFSDILVVPEAMGMQLDFTEHGPVFKNALSSRKNEDIQSLDVDYSKLDYIYKNIERIKLDKPKHIPLIGFCGAPLTTLCYMIQGFSTNHVFPDAVNFLYAEKETAKILIDKITDVSITYALNQIKSGVDIFQLFETHAGLIPNELYNEMIMPSIRRFADAIRSTGTPFIYFPKGLGFGIQDIDSSICDFLSIDWQTSMFKAREVVDSKVGLQGNLDPRILFSNQNTIEKELRKYKEFHKQNNKWIFNLGHGFIPKIPLENVKFVVDFIKNEF